MKAIRQKFFFREKVGLSDFELLHLVGKGSFGKVMQVYIGIVGTYQHRSGVCGLLRYYYKVKMKETGKVYAMKVLDKKLVVEHNEVQHTLGE
jgi:hypothetical protein